MGDTMMRSIRCKVEVMALPLLRMFIREFDRAWDALLRVKIDQALPERRTNALIGRSTASLWLDYDASNRLLRWPKVLLQGSLGSA